MDELKRTPIYEKHVKLGAKMVPFGGWDMPVQYKDGILSEHHHTREKVSLFDTCHMGEFTISGKGSALALDRIFPRAVADQKVGVARYNFLLSDKGTVMDDLLIYRMGEEEFMIVVNAGTIDSDFARIKSLIPSDLYISNNSEKIGKLDLQGPKAAEIMEELGFKRETLPSNYKWIKTSINGIPAIVSRTGYTGELGFEFYVEADKVGELWNILLSFNDVKPAGLGARDTLRLEVGYPLYGHEMDENTTPVEAGFSAIMSLEKRSAFMCENILKDPSKITKNLIGIILEGRRAARAGNKVFTTEGKEIGSVTSGMFSPILEKAIALAYVKPESGLTPGKKVNLEIGGKLFPGDVVEMPFYKNGTVRMKIC
ncbi:MAG TPA: glycine cleavage system aminomethyltransferase GcvT [Lentisphaeria bacterium]|nr:MAG: glycine cleavage system protein T [Lentisphaerae bacterium GWF2_38_69]HBM15241.1 glycine cleavage system aminomethyltransferase GcvT [Lentisphaeria bacterium]